MTLTLGKAAKPKAPRAPKASADAARLKRLAARIEELKDHRLNDLSVELFAAEKMRIKTIDDVMIVTMAGVRGEGAGGLFVALSNWANAARRQLIQGENAQ